MLGEVRRGEPLIGEAAGTKSRDEYFNIYNFGNNARLEKFPHCFVPPMYIKMKILVCLHSFATLSKSAVFTGEPLCCNHSFHSTWPEAFCPVLWSVLSAPSMIFRLACTKNSAAEEKVKETIYYCAFQWLTFMTL